MQHLKEGTIQRSIKSVWGISLSVSPSQPACQTLCGINVNKKPNERDGAEWIWRVLGDENSNANI